jgi:hypothetical protein
MPGELIDSLLDLKDAIPATMDIPDDDPVQ